MKLVRYLHRNKESYGILLEDQIIDLLKLAATTGNSNIPSTIEELISLGTETESLLKKSSG